VNNQCSKVLIFSYYINSEEEGKICAREMMMVVVMGEEQLGAHKVCLNRGARHGSSFFS
jgi:hypothetical protein